MELRATKRTVTGRKAARLRKKGLLPAVVYGKNFAPLPLALNFKDFKKIYKGVGEAELLDLVVDRGQPIKVLIKDAQYDPVSDEIIHVDLHKVELTEKVRAAVPIEIVGESPIVKAGEGTLLTLLDEVEVEALPLDLPKKITVDISELKKVGDGIKVSQLPVDNKKVKIEHEEDELVLKIDYPEMLAEEEEKETTPEEVAVTAEKAAADAEEGEKKPEKKGQPSAAE